MDYLIRWIKCFKNILKSNIKEPIRSNSYLSHRILYSFPWIFKLKIIRLKPEGPKAQALSSKLKPGFLEMTYSSCCSRHLKDWKYESKMFYPFIRSYNHEEATLCWRQLQKHVKMTTSLCTYVLCMVLVCQQTRNICFIATIFGNR